MWHSVSGGLIRAVSVTTVGKGNAATLLFFPPTLVLSTRKCTVTFSRLHQKGTGYPGQTLHHFSSESWHRLTKGTRQNRTTSREKSFDLSHRIARTGVWHADFRAVAQNFVNCCLEWAALPAAQFPKSQTALVLEPGPYLMIILNTVYADALSLCHVIAVAMDTTWCKWKSKAITSYGP